MYATVVDVDGDDVVLEVAPDVEVRYLKRAIMEVIEPGEEPETYEDDETAGYHEDAEDEEADGTAEDSDDVKSAEDGLTDSHDDLAKSDKDNVH
jgi:preprotein translocase subunit YajC